MTERHLVQRQVDGQPTWGLMSALGRAPDDDSRYDVLVEAFVVLNAVVPDAEGFLLLEVFDLLRGLMGLDYVARTRSVENR